MSKIDKEDYVFQDEDDIVWGMPPRSELETFYKDFEKVSKLHDKLDDFLKNMYEQAVFEANQEKLPEITEKIENKIIIIQFLVRKYPQYALQMKNEVEKQRHKYHLKY